MWKLADVENGLYSVLKMELIDNTLKPRDFT